MIEKVIAYLLAALTTIGYPGIVLLMAMESSFFPIPSELVIPPAGYLASIGSMNVFLVILFGTLGSVLGALFNYYLGARFGKRVILHFGKYVGLTPERYQTSESFFLKHGNMATFLGRLLLGIRHFISFPAGVSRMPLVPFIGYTALGSALWCGVLAYLGYIVGQNQDLLKQYYHTITYGLILFCLIIGLIYFLAQSLKKSDT